MTTLAYEPSPLEEAQMEIWTALDKVEQLGFDTKGKKILLLESIIELLKENK